MQFARIIEGEPLLKGRLTTRLYFYPEEESKPPLDSRYERGEARDPIPKELARKPGAEFDKDREKFGGMSDEEVAEGARREEVARKARR